MSMSYGSQGSRFHVTSAPHASGGRPIPVRQDPSDFSEVTKPHGFKPARLPLTLKVLTFGGLAVLFCLVALPVSDAAILLHDFNCAFWIGQALPAAVIISLVTLLIVYFLWVVVGMGAKGVENLTLQDLATLVSTFICLLGVILVLTSLYLYWMTFHITSALTYDCQGSAVSRDISLYYLSLLTLRQSAACAKKFSIEECKGYAAAAPHAYTSYLQSLETYYHCSGFCFTGKSNGNSSLLEAEYLQKTKQDDKFLADVASDHAPGSSTVPSFLSKGSGFAQTAVQSKAEMLHRNQNLPPALFSQTVYKTSCDGAASRNLTFAALNTSHVWWLLGVVLIALSAVVGIGEWFGRMFKGSRSA